MYFLFVTFLREKTPLFITSKALLQRTTRKELIKSTLKRFECHSFYSLPIVSLVHLKMEIIFRKVTLKIISFFQNSWTDSDDREISRDQLMKALHRVEAVLIRASYNTRMLQATYDQQFVLMQTNRCLPSLKTK